MELELVVRARRVLAGQAFEPEIVTLHHRKTGEGTKSGMICSGSQTNLYFLCDPVRDLPPITEAGQLLESGSPGRLSLGRAGFSVRACEPDLSRAQLSLDAASSEWVYTEELFNRKRIAIIGGGHCSVALSRVMRQLDYDVLVYDTREQVATAQTNPFANHLEVVSDYRETGGRIPFPEATPVVVMTSDFKSDSRGLRGALDHPFPFVGVMGSRSKIKAIFECLRGEGVADERLADLKAPVGLPMRSGTPEEIAVSVAAQILRDL